MTAPDPDDPAATLARARAGLLRACEPPAPAVAAYAEQVGAVHAWEAVRTRRAPRGVLAATAARTGDPGVLDDQVEHDLAVARRTDARLLGPGDPEWPTAAFAAFVPAQARGVQGAAPPIALYARGRPLGELPWIGVTIVGSRASTTYGQRIAADLAAQLAADGLVIVSGAAFGIDTAAHRAALLAGGPGCTVAVLACGIDRAYPQANEPLLREIVRSGTVVSEYPPGSTPARHRFLVRNRLIAALGAGTVVVEAGRRSGTLSTAAAADQLGRLVMAVPGPVTSAMSVGCHLLLADRFAQLVSGVDDVRAALARGPTREQPGPPAPEPALFDPRHPTDGLDPETARVYDALPARGSRSIEQLAVEAALGGREVLGALAVLDVHGLAARDGPAWRRTRPGA